MTDRDRRERPLLALTMGDPAGIGPEILVKALCDRGVRERLRPLVVADAATLRAQVEMLGAELNIVEVTTGSGGLSPFGPEPDSGQVEVVDLANVEGDVNFGEVRGRYGRAAVESIERACELVCAGAVDGIVTAPISKEAIRAGGSVFPGHTEMLASLLGVAPEAVFTMFVLDRLRIFFLSRHASLSDTIGALSTSQVVHGLVRVQQLLEELGIRNPRVALAALNPHGGENGLLGREELEVLAPAARQARSKGVDVHGPVPADAVFHQARQGRYDGVLSLYHDQGHVAAKTVDFFGTVSCTLGLPVIRTSVDHGTAFDIAGKGVADPSGQVAALEVAASLAGRVLAVRGRRPAGGRGPGLNGQAGMPDAGVVPAPDRTGV
ncbi:MAG: 4-hydroxythreonine-4-phosphate dehydrogenase PdxA [Actinomycetota bacterium]|nr:4-hydroxythreonine-4-phosphate dehydrogenase PdxA [Actinomycetota bacterium]